MRKGKSVQPVAMPDLRLPFTPLQLAKAITSKRTTLNLRQADVADTLGMSKSTLVKIEKGDIGVNLNNVLKVMEYLGLSFQIRTDEPSSLSPFHVHPEVDDDWT
ncbi:helix-turn-helix domain-containing protein [Ferrimonas kyonanensis]|uniref:helix-turn-helix domain-containing protein n=1 Tax=Ferrimonas kyonanensis TaxID=364763 RepID=UPI000489AA66|nr:helix-turn-helix domain-containing protein [Ferrimonas kyonanensis]